MKIVTVHDGEQIMRSPWYAETKKSQDQKTQKTQKNQDLKKFAWSISEFTAPGFLEEETIEKFRVNNYPIPQDCPGDRCRDLRPACKLGICKIAILICGDF